MIVIQVQIIIWYVHVQPSNNINCSIVTQWSTMDIDYKEHDLYFLQMTMFSAVLVFSFWYLLVSIILFQSFILSLIFTN